MSLRRHTPCPATQWTGDTAPTPRTAPMRMRYHVARLTVPAPVSKGQFLRSEPYRRWVAALDCAHCGIGGYSNACHADQGKGLSLKACDSTVWPGCVTRPGRVGCHDSIGATGQMTRDARRELEARYGEATRAAARAAGVWPKGWPA